MQLELVIGSWYKKEGRDFKILLLDDYSFFALEIYKTSL